MPATLLQKSHPALLTSKSIAVADRADSGAGVGLEIELPVDPVGFPVLLQPCRDAVPRAVHVVVGHVNGSNQVAAGLEGRQWFVGEHRRDTPVKVICYFLAFCAKV